MWNCQRDGHTELMIRYDKEKHQVIMLKNEFLVIVTDLIICLWINHLIIAAVEDEGCVKSYNKSLYRCDVLHFRGCAL